MKVDYFFPIFKEDDCKTFLKRFCETKFFQKYNEYKMIFVVSKKDKKNLDFLSSEAIRHQEYKVLVFDKDFTYNDAFYNAINYFEGEIVLLGDLKIAKIDLIFQKCIEKKEKKASVVHVVKKRKKFKAFIFNTLNGIYNFFIKLFTNKKDKLNVTSLGLIDKNVIDLLKTLSNKCCYLKNTKDLKGFETRTIYIDDTTKTYKDKFNVITTPMKIVIWSIGIFCVDLICIILLNTLLKNVPIALNIVLVFVELLSLVSASMLLPKHFFDIRNKENKKAKFNIKEIN